MKLTAIMMPAALAGGLGLAACSEGESTPDTCGAQDASAFIGAPLPEGAFDSRTAPVRVLPPGSAVTMDYREDRLNVDLDADGRVLRAYCG